LCFRLRSPAAGYGHGMPDLEDQGSQLIETIGDLVDIAAAVPPEEGFDGLDKTVTEVFFRDWPTVRSWGDSLYERIENDLGRSPLPDQDPKSPETGNVD
jgi:hypothetical protein